MRKTWRRKPLKAGTRVRLKTRTVDGWKGTDTVIWTEVFSYMLPDGGKVTVGDRVRYFAFGYYESAIIVEGDHESIYLTIETGETLREFLTDVVDRIRRFVV